MKTKIKITGVNYLNTFPFKYAIEKSESIQQWADINYATPYECAQMLLNKQTNIALAPVAVLNYDKHLKIITEFCLSTHNKVDSVKLYSHKPVYKITSVTLDYQSLSSVSLIRILMKYYWKKEVEYIQGEKGFEKKFSTDAIVVIGDRTFELNGTFEYEYDLGYEWYQFFGKPFVFAAWISNIDLNDKQINELNTVFEFGINNIDLVIADTLKNTNVLKYLDEQERAEKISDYLKTKIEYRLTEDRKQSIEYFLNLLKTIENKEFTKV